MVRYSVTTIRRFIASIKKPSRLLKGCERFYREEPRDIVYITSRKIMCEKPHSEYHILAGIEVLLLIWNAAYYRGKRARLQNKLEDDLLSAYRKVKADVNSIKNKKLETINLQNRNIIDKIKKIFTTFSNFKSIGVVGASKALHLINPDLFMMWDTEIRTNYHRVHRFDGRGCTLEKTTECYIEFLRDAQCIANSVLSLKTKNQLQNSHPVKMDSTLKAFTSPIIISVPKMIDECNFVKFSRRKFLNPSKR